MMTAVSVFSNKDRLFGFSALGGKKEERNKTIRKTDCGLSEITGNVGFGHFSLFASGNKTDFPPYMFVNTVKNLSPQDEIQSPYV